MRNTFVAFLLGIILCVGAYWFLTQGQKKPSVQEVRDSVAAGAEKVKNAVKDAVGEIRTDDIKEELGRTGKVVRQKAKNVGEAVASAAENTRTTAAIKAKLIAEPGLSALKISVDTTGGLVTLSGTVSSHEQIAKAMQLALDTDGVREVVSTLQVKQSKSSSD